MVWLAFLTACQSPEPKLHYESVSWHDLPYWDRDNLATAQSALRRSCRISLHTAGDAHQPFCTALLTYPRWRGASLKNLIQKHYAPYKLSIEGSSNGRFTGYYEPLLNGSHKPSSRFQTPLYKLPSSLNEAGLMRAAIGEGALNGKGLELVWVDDPIEAFFLEIQGSGRIRLPNGRFMRVGYAGANGHPYTAIGKVLVETSALQLKEVSMQSIKAWLRSHPDQAQEVMNRNQSYVFFKELTDEGPLGAQGVPLQPRRSIAVDPRFIPLGSLLWVDIEHPTRAQGRLQHLMVAQDKGGAIKGALRGDYFWGFGSEAAHNAGLMNSTGALYILLPISVPSLMSFTLS